jgi:uncharacterized membrane protein
MELWISYLLRIGVALCTLFFSLGLVLELIFQSPSSKTFFLSGLSVLIFLPFLRVFLMAVLFALQRDFIFVLFSVIVLGLLSCGVFLGLSL